MSMLAQISKTALIVILGVTAIACGTDANGSGAPPAEAAAVSVKTAAAVEQQITRFIRVTGTLTAQEEAEVAAEIAGRVVSTPVERGTLVRAGGDLIRIAAAEVEAQAREAEANAAQIEARLGNPDDEGFDIDRVPEVASAKASYDLAQSDFVRARMLFEKQLVSQAEFDRSRAQAENMRRQYETAQNGAQQQRQALIAARARLALARKAVADTVVRAPFDGVVGERLVSVGDYVTRGAKVALVMRVDPLRVELTVPAQYISAVAEGRAVSLTVDAYPGQTFTGRVRYVSPQVRADSRALVVEAVVPNAGSVLKPGLFATAEIEEASQTPGVLVPADAVRTISGTARVYVVSGGQAEERIVTTGQRVGALMEITSGVKAGERVANSNFGQLADGVRVAVTE
jgi:multidrug efflux pump subunit AcrA (membrane-fusion protein)